MKVKEFVSAFIPEWTTEFNHKAMKIKKLYPEIFKGTDFEIRWLSPEDLVLFEHKLSESQFTEYTQQWQKAHKVFWDKKKEIDDAFEIYISNQISKIFETSEAIHPLTGLKHVANRNVRNFFIENDQPGFYILDVSYDYLLGSANRSPIRIEDKVYVFYSGGKVDIMIHAMKQLDTISYIQNSDDPVFLKFPVDHILFNRAAILTLELSVFRHIIEKTMNVKVERSIIHHKHKSASLPHKEWEVQNMFMYYNTMKELDYSHIY